MLTAKQDLGRKGEELVAAKCRCARCKRERTLRRLPANFKCADVICDFCGYVAQVKTSRVLGVERVPDRILGAAWSVQKERMEAGIFFPLFLVLVSGRTRAIYYLSADLQSREIFAPRRPLSANARRAGWRGFVYNLRKVPTGAIVRLL